MALLCSQMNQLTLGSSSKQVHALPVYHGCHSVKCRAARMERTTARVSFGRLPLQIQCARIANVEVPNQKRIETSLTYIFGIGNTTAKKVLVATGIENKRTYDLSTEELTQLTEEVEKYQIEGDLRQKIAFDIKRLKEIGCYRGRRHIMGLPVRGQKTKTNARTRKGRRGSAVKK